MKKYRGKTFTGKVVSLHMGNNADLSKQARSSLNAEIGGFAGDKHQGPVRQTWEGELQPAGTIRRNERQWSGVSVEELAYITERRRGVVGVIEVPGEIRLVDEVEVRVYEQPVIRLL